MLSAKVGVFLTLLSTLVVRDVTAYTSGAPADACDNMTPGHYANPQTSASPYLLTAAYDEVSDTYTVTLDKDTAQPSTPPFMGFLIQARVRGTEEKVGVFGTPPEGTHYLDCGAPSNSVTHGTKANKDSVTFTWTPPTGGVAAGTRFVGTVVQSFGTFWLQIQSADLS